MGLSLDDLCFLTLVQSPGGKHYVSMGLDTTQQLYVRPAQDQMSDAADRRSIRSCNPEYSGMLLRIQGAGFTPSHCFPKMEVPNS